MSRVPTLARLRRRQTVEIFSQMLVAKGGANVGVAVFVGVALLSHCFQGIT